MEIAQTTADSLIVLTVKGRVDVNTAAQFEQKLSEVLNQGAKQILIDCTGLEFISSAGLRTLLVAGKRLKASQGGLVLSGLKQPIREAFDVSGFSSLFNIYDTAESAISATAAVSNP